MKKLSVFISMLGVSTSLVLARNSQGNGGKLSVNRDRDGDNLTPGVTHQLLYLTEWGGGGGGEAAGGGGGSEGKPKEEKTNI